MILYESFRKTVAVRDIVRGVHSNLLAVHDGHEQKFGTASVNEAGAISAAKPVQKLYSHELSRNSNSDPFVMRSDTLANSFKNFTYLYTVITNEKVPETLGDPFSCDCYAWNS